MPSLLLHAEDPYWSPPDPAQLTGVLSHIALIGARREAFEGEAFYAGDAFLNLVMFLGCSPQVELDPDTAPVGTSVCYVQIHEFSEPILLSAGKAARPRCPRCRATLEHLPALSPGNTCHCSACKQSFAVEALDWRRAAGFGRFFIEIHGIYPQEALPADKLLATLQSHAGCRWNYFYK